MTVPPELWTAFAALRAEPAQLRRSLKTAAIPSQLLAGEGLRPVVVGGTAVSFYTSGVFESLDLDLLVPGLEPAARVLLDLGFTRRGASFAHPTVPVVVDFPPEPLEGEADLIRTVDIDGVPVRVIGIEDLLPERLCLGVREGDHRAADSAIAMAVAHWDEIDWAYVHRESGSPACSPADALPDFLKQAADVRRDLPGHA